MNNQEEIELETVEAQYWVDMMEALEELEKHPAYKKVIVEGYFEKKALDGVSLLAVPAIKKAGERPDIMEDLVAISNLRYHLQMIKNFGSIAKEDLEEATGPDVEA